MFSKKNLIQSGISLGIFLLLTMVIFYPQLQGKKYKAGDNIEYLAKSQEIRDLREDLGRQILWSDAIFSGMPSYFVNLSFKGNIFKDINDFLLSTLMKRPVSLFFIGLIVMFFSLKAIKINHWLATVGALAAVLSVNNFVLYSAGHNAKILTLFYLPLLLSGVILLFRQKWILGAILFTLGSVMTIMANHPQMVYYFVLALIPWFIYQTVQLIRRQKFMTAGKIYGILALGLALGILSNASRLWTTLEYSKASTRGGTVLHEESQTNTQKGLGWEYAMQWSNTVDDLWASLVPGAVGGSSQEPVPRNTELEQLLKQSGGVKKGSKYLGPLYWGELPFTSGPIYLGAALLLLVVFGFPYLTAEEKWLFGGAFGLTLLLSLGKNAAWFNHFLFDYFPMFNNFRTPNSALSILPTFLSFSAVIGLDRWHKQLDAEKKNNPVISKKIWIRTGAVAGICLIFAVAGSGFFSFEGANAQNYAQQGVLDVIIDARKALLRQDSWRSFFFVILATLPLIGLYKNKGSWHSFLIITGVILMIDALPVSFRYFDYNSFESPRQFEQTFSMRPVDEQIKSMESNRADYRVLDLSVNTFNTNMTSYHHNTIGGYHALKMSRYQDLIDGYISQGNQNVLNMLNTKYIITQDGQLNTNPGALGPAWFVEDIRYAHSADEEFRQLNETDLSAAAIVSEPEFGDILSNRSDFSAGTVTRTNSVPDDLIYETQNDGEGFLVFSELWYDGPGWTAYVDGEEAPLIRANFTLRGIAVPAGSHTIRLTFTPQSYVSGENITLFSTLFILAGILFFGYREYKDPKTEEGVE